MSRSVSRRLLVGGTSAALLLGAVGIVPLLGTASAAGCPTWTDPSGDSGFLATEAEGAGAPAPPADPTSDDDLDIVKTVVGTDAAGGMTVAVTVKKLDAAGPANNPGDEFLVKFNVAGAASSVALKRDDVIGAVRVATLKGTASAAGKVVYDTKTNTVTGTFTAADVKAALGKPIAGLKLDTFTTLAYGYQDSGNSTVGGLGFPLTDQSIAATSLTYTDAGGCGDAAGAPAPTGSPSGSPTPTPTPTASTPPSSGPTLFDQPRKGCVQFTDPTGDADPTGSGHENEDALDVTQVNLKSPGDGSIQVYVKVTNLGGGTNLPEEGGLYDVTFNLAGKAVEAAVDDTGAITSAMVGGKANTDLKPTAKLDTKNNEVVFTFNQAGLEKALATTLTAGSEVTGTTVTTSGTFPVVGARKADTAAGTTAAQKTYAYGDNACFLPPAGTFAIAADPKGEYTHTTELFATLNDADGSPVQGVPITASLSGGKVVTAITDNDGVADLTLPIAVPAGKKSINIAFAGNSDVGATKASSPFTVVADKAVLKAKAIHGGVQATLLDDAKHVIAGQAVVFTIGNTHKVVKTNSKGVALLGGLKAGTVVKVSYAGKSGYYTATPTYTVQSL